MKLVIQRVKKASVKINDKVVGEIKKGLLVLLGISSYDDYKNIEWFVNKLVNLRIFEDENGKINLSVKDVEGKILVISQFTLYANTKRGNRPDFLNAAKPSISEPIYNKFIEELSKRIDVETGKFGANMEVELINYGPVTIILEK